MSVKTIFYTLIGTIVVIVTGCMLVELFNISIYSSQIANLAKVSAYQSCALFTQETYKTDLTANYGAVASPDILDSEGNLYISGDFYPGDTVEEIYLALYKSSDFTTAMSPLRSTYTNLDLMMKGLENNGHVTVPAISWNSSNADIQANRNATKANQFYKDHYTPANLGIPYMDIDTVSKMFRWNLAQLYSNCDSDLIQIDQTGKQFVNYKGFRCYVQDAQITNCTYEVYYMGKDPTGNEPNNHANESVAADFTARTGIRVKDVNGDTTGITVSTTKDIAGNIVKDNAAVTVVEVDYTMPVAYQGITPLDTLFEFVWNNSVEGLSGGPVDRTVTEDFDNLTTSQVTSTNVNGSHTIPSAGKLLFVLVN